MNLFFDTSALVKLFHVESGSKKVEQLINDRANTIYVSALSTVEFCSTIYRKFREGVLTQTQTSQAIKDFEEQLKYFSVEPMSQVVIDEAKTLISNHGKTHALKTLDSMQLAGYTLIAANDWRFVLADEKLSRVINSMGLKTILIQ